MDIRYSYLWLWWSKTKQEHSEIMCGQRWKYKHCAIRKSSQLTWVITALLVITVLDLHGLPASSVNVLKTWLQKLFLFSDITWFRTKPHISLNPPPNHLFLYSALCDMVYFVTLSINSTWLVGTIFIGAVFIVSCILTRWGYSLFWCLTWVLLSIMVQSQVLFF
jgi:hypothetical protein